MAVTHRARRLTEAHASPRHLAEVLYRIRGLRMIGHVLHVGAHPDDEDAGLIAFVARKYGARMVYWSATREEAGQNRIGSHSGDALGIYRTWESLAARTIDGGESWSTEGSAGRPRIDSHDGEANPLWGAPRIHGELLKLGIDVSQATVAKYMPRHRRPPSQTWRTFLTNHVGQIRAADFFVVPTATYRLLFVLVILAHERRHVVHVAVTAHPTAAWTAQQLREASADEVLVISFAIVIPPLPGSDPRRLGWGSMKAHRATLTVAERVRGASHRPACEWMPSSYIC